MPCQRSSSPHVFPTDQSERKKGDTCDRGERGAHDPTSLRRVETFPCSPWEAPPKGGHWRPGLPLGAGGDTCLFLGQRGRPSMQGPFFSRKDSGPCGPRGGTDPHCQLAGSGPSVSRSPETRGAGWPRFATPRPSLQSDGGELTVGGPRDSLRTARSPRRIAGAVRPDHVALPRGQEAHVEGRVRGFTRDIDDVDLTWQFGLEILGRCNLHRTHGKGRMNGKCPGGMKPQAWMERRKGSEFR